FDRVSGGKLEFISFLKQENSEENQQTDEAFRISITTVHKAKGREFDYVIYIPSRKTGADPSGVDLVMNSILQSMGQHYNPEDRDREENRIDFVAMTRTKGDLWIITKRKEAERYRIDNLIESAEIEEKSPEFKTYTTADIESERHKSNDKIEEKWLLEFISRKISKLKRLSFSMLGSVEDLPSFVSRYILGINDFSTSLQLGSDIHKTIENYLTKKEEPGLMSTDLQAKSWENFRKYYADVNKLPEIKWIISEGTVQCSVKELFNDLNTDLSILGKIDAGYTFSDGGIEKIRIVDFKTSKEVKDNLDSYIEQISLYSKIYSIQKNVPIEKIEGEIVMLSTREGKIYNGKVELKVFQANTLMIERSLEGIKDKIDLFIEFQRNPKTLYESVIVAKEKYKQTEIFKQVQKEISKELMI
ncbi:MAG: 3'-5' exonuclease, partial [Thermoplasmataceae archaeon]